MNTETLNVNGFTVRLIPYTEKRRKALDEIQQEIEKFIKDNPNKPYDDIPIRKKAEWWQRKARVLWEPLLLPEDVPGKLWDKPDNHFSLDFYMDEDFEYPLLQKTEVFFRSQRLYL